jgi:hypothetical protein
MSGPPSRGTSATTVAVAALCAGFALVVVWAVVGTASRVRALDERRAEALATRVDPVTVAGPVTPAFIRFRELLDGDSRFLLVYDAAVAADQRRTYRLVGGYYLYPAIAVTDLEAANAVMVFGAPSEAVRSSFVEVATVDGVWLGRRRAA